MLRDPLGSSQSILDGLDIPLGFRLRLQGPGGFLDTGSRARASMASKDMCYLTRLMYEHARDKSADWIIAGGDTWNSSYAWYTRSWPSGPRPVAALAGMMDL